MKKILQKLQHTIVFLLKATLYLLLASIFFGMLSIDHAELRFLSPTSVVSLFTFAVTGLAMTAAYGKYDIGRRKSKPIIYSIVLAVFLTDAVTYLQLSIMANNDGNPRTFWEPGSIGLLVIAFFLQILLIVTMTYLGNYIFFRINPPEKTCVVTVSQQAAKRLLPRIRKFKKQYVIGEVLLYSEKDIYSRILPYDTVFLCDVPADHRSKIIEFCYRYAKNIYFTPDMADIVEINAHHFVMDDMSLVQAQVHSLSLEQRAIKRTMDIVLSLLAILVTSPVWIICAIGIKACDGGPVFFKQKRATKGGKVFEVFKFRTMRENVENRSVTAGDDRITPVGKLLRKFRLDELPQLWNILKGDMSLVGPRPEMLENVWSYTEQLPEFAYRLRVKAGLTGYAQIAGKYNTSPKDKLFLDLMYIENYSVWKDIKLLLQTLVVFFKSDSTEAFDEEAEGTAPEKKA